VKTPGRVLDALRKRVEAGWHLDLDSVRPDWPHRFVIGSVTQPELEADFPAFQQRASEWREWTATDICQPV
jgi:hypothetical protein